MRLEEEKENLRKKKRNSLGKRSVSRHELRKERKIHRDRREKQATSTPELSRDRTQHHPRTNNRGNGKRTNLKILGKGGLLKTEGIVLIFRTGEPRAYLKAIVKKSRRGSRSKDRGAYL